RFGTLVERRARGFDARERRPETDRKARLSRANPLDETVMLQRVRTLELHVGRPFSAPKTKSSGRLRPCERSAAKASRGNRSRGSRRNGVCEKRHEARRSCAVSRVSTALSTTFSPR